jgi:predicted O-methyltransferase YrrM
LRGDFKDVIQQLKPESYDLIFFDGNHKKEPTLEYFDTLLSCVHNETVFIFDDIYWSKGMTEAWKTMIQHPKVTVSIDTFFWGILFFRKEQAKEHFVIRVQ